MLAVFDARQDLLFGGAIAAEFIRDDDPRHIPQALQQLAEESFRRVLVPPALHQDIEDMAILIDRPPQIVAFTPHAEKHLIQMPFVARSRAPAAQLIGIGLPKFPTPLSHRLIRQDDATLGHELFDIPIAEAETKVQPDAVADDLGREAMTLLPVDWWGWVHAASLAGKTGAGGAGR
jgi:hypothetical protein